MNEELIDSHAEVHKLEVEGVEHEKEEGPDLALVANIAIERIHDKNEGQHGLAKHEGDELLCTFMVK
jgi:hypothetical protein